MVDRITKEKRSAIMSAIRSTNTRPEIALRSELWRNGFRFRVYFGPEKIDVAFPSRKVAIFVDGCFWHGCPIHFRFPKSRKAYWHPKLKRNMKRDEEIASQLRTKGWKVLRFWEHELKKMDGVIEKIRLALESDVL